MIVGLEVNPLLNRKSVNALPMQMYTNKMIERWYDTSTFKKECSFFNLQSRLKTHTVLVIGLYELLYPTA